MTDPKKNDSYISSYTDVADSDWFAQSVKYLSSIGIVQGYPEGDFRPDNPITRAEFASVISKYGRADSSLADKFADIEGHWAAAYINNVAAEGWINGYSDGSFRPDEYLTRAEIVTIINRILKRTAQLEDIQNPEQLYTDIDESHWAYADIIEASSGRKPD